MNPSPSTSPRLVSLDVMRGIVMVLMAVDHVDAVVNPAHAMTDGRLFPQDAMLSAPDFLTRWCSHLCAPTFVFLAGMGIALGAAGRAGGRGFDRGLAARAVVLLALEFVVLSTCFRAMEGGFAWAFTEWLPVFPQVIYAIGAAMLAMVLLRRSPPWLQVALAGALLVGSELLAAGAPPGGPLRLLHLLLLEAGVWSRTGDGFDVLVLYPALPWLAVALLGHAVGSRHARTPLPARAWSMAGVSALALFTVVRWVDGFGNQGLHRRDGSLLEWLRCSKYPPSVSFLAMELGLMALCMGALQLGLDGRARQGPVTRSLLVLGRVPLFFYLLHLLLLALFAGLNAMPVGTGSWRTAWIGAVLLVAVCWPSCAAYARYKHAGGRPWTRYL